ncbi:hypothetical protein BDW_04505 [Bdellovibrio bacteriovorus W]|nr:hypothetical protein BDW_04505 [Bdellovibrio bacteriovorus W]
MVESGGSKLQKVTLLSQSHLLDGTFIDILKGDRYDKHTMSFSADSQNSEARFRNNSSSHRNYFEANLKNTLAGF